MPSRSTTHHPALPASDGHAPERELPPVDAAAGASTAPTPDDEPTVISKPRSSDAWLGARRLSSAEIGKLLTGERLGQFELEEFIGGGGMGAVFRALDTTLNREVAVKVLSRDQGSDEETLRRFRNEAQSAARLDHDNIARVYYVGDDRGVHYIVFEYIEGTNLRDLVGSGGPLSLADAVSYTLQIAEALDHASARDVIHRDIKPSNVLITPDGKAKLVDMGLARLHQVEQSSDDLTASGVTLGTFDYISPEQARDPRMADVRSDLYSLGCSLYFMLTGRPPFAQGTALQKLLQHQGVEPDDPRSLRPDLPADLTRILHRLLAKNPAKRYQTPQELIVELSILGEQLGIHSASLPVFARPAPPSAWRQHVPWAAPLLLLVAAVIGLDAYWSRPRTSVAAPVAINPNGTPNLGSSRGKNSNPGGAAADVGPNAQRTTSPSSINTGGGQSTVPTLGSAAQASAAQGGLPLERSAIGLLVEYGVNRWLEQGSFSGDWGSQALRTTAAAADLLRRFAPEASSLGGRPTAATAGKSEIPARDRVLIVSSMDAGPLSYTSLQAACAAAKTGDTIELAFDGPRDEKPLQLANLHLTIRAAVGYYPVLRFRPDTIDTGRAHSMFAISGGQLTLVDLAIDWQIPQELRSDGWALFELRRADLLRMDRVWLTVRNSGRGRESKTPDVCVLELRKPPGGGTMSMIEPGRGGEHRTALELTDCLVRGEATFLKSAESQAVRLGWSNGLLATSESLLGVSGTTSASSPAALIECDLRHLTIMSEAGLAVMSNAEEAPFMPQVSLRLADSLVMVGTGQALVDQRGIDSPEVWRGRVAWSADRVHYAGSDAFWRISNTFAPIESSRWSFAQWREFWGPSRENNTRAAGIALENPPPLAAPYQSHTPEDYRLATDLAHPARRAASDGFDLGLRSSRLPPSPDAYPAARDTLE